MRRSVGGSSSAASSAATEAKLDVARERGLPVVMLRRPPLPGVDRAFDSVAALLAALDEPPTLRRI